MPRSRVFIRHNRWEDWFNDFLSLAMTHNLWKYVRRECAWLQDPPKPALLERPMDATAFQVQDPDIMDLIISFHNNYGYDANVNEMRDHRNGIAAVALWMRETVTTPYRNILFDPNCTLDVWYRNIRDVAKDIEAESTPNAVPPPAPARRLQASPQQLLIEQQQAVQQQQVVPHPRPAQQLPSAQHQQQPARPLQPVQQQQPARQQRPARPLQSIRQRQLTLQQQQVPKTTPRAIQRAPVRQESAAVQLLRRLTVRPIPQVIDLTDDYPETPVTAPSTSTAAPIMALSTQATITPSPTQTPVLPPANPVMQQQQTPAYSQTPPPPYTPRTTRTRSMHNRLAKELERLRY